MVVDEKGTTKPEEEHIEGDKNEAVFTPFEVKGDIDYDTIIKKFGCSKVDKATLDLIEKASGRPPHHLIRRRLYYAHRELDVVMREYMAGEDFYLFTGRGPSSASMHLGHMIPFIMTKYFQDAFNAPCVIQISDDEKLFFKDNMTVTQLRRLGLENIKDIIAFGFDPKKTFIFSDFDYMGHLYPAVMKIAKRVQTNTIRAIFGFKDESIIVGKYIYPVIQAAPSFSMVFKPQFQGKKIRCLIPCAIDQDPYFRMCRDVAPRCNQKQPTTVYSVMLPGLAGPKMSATNANSVVFLSDTPAQIKNKILKHAVSGGKDTLEEHRRLGGDLQKDTAFQYLRFFMEDDDKLAEIGRKYSSGEMLSNDVKQALIDVLIPIIEEYQKRRAEITDEMVAEFMQRQNGEYHFKNLEFADNPFVKKVDVSELQSYGELKDGVLLETLTPVHELGTEFHIMEHKEMENPAEEKLFRAKLKGVYCDHQLYRAKSGETFLVVSHSDTVIRAEELSITMPFLPMLVGTSRVPNKVTLVKTGKKRAKKEAKNQGFDASKISPLGLAAFDPLRKIIVVLDQSLKDAEFLNMSLSDCKNALVLVTHDVYIAHLKCLGYKPVFINFE